MLKVRYWVPNPVNDGPSLVEYPVPADTRAWPKISHALVHLAVDLPQGVLEWLIEDAQEEGWGFNSFTRCFYRL